MNPEIEEGLLIVTRSKLMSIYDASKQYQEEGISSVVFAGKEYGTGSSRDWAAKGTLLLGIRVVIAESFERIHRSNLIGMGVLPCTFIDGINRETLKLKGDEVIDLVGISAMKHVRSKIEMVITRANGNKDKVDLIACIDTLDELSYFKNGGFFRLFSEK